MEQVKIRAYFIGVVLILLGLVITLIPAAKERPLSQAWLNHHAPMRIGNYRMIPSPEDPWASYRMPEEVYKALKPDAMLARIYENPSNKKYDVLLLLSRSKNSFHNPEVCFSSQGWSIQSQHQDEITTPYLGILPITVVKMSSVSQKDQLAAFFYKGPGGYFGSTEGFKWGLLRDELLKSKQPEGIFFRFIPEYSGEDIHQLKKFILEYIEEAHRTSYGFF